MKEAALARAHGSEGVGFAGVADAGDSGGGLLLELEVALGFEAVGVEGNAVVLVGGEAEDLGAEVLECEKEFAVARGEEGGVGAEEVEGKNSGFGVRIVGSGEGEVEASVVKGGVEEVRGGLEDRVGRGHSGGISPLVGRISFSQRLPDLANGPTGGHRSAGGALGD